MVKVRFVMEKCPVKDFGFSWRLLSGCLLFLEIMTDQGGDCILGMIVVYILFVGNDRSKKGMYRVTYRYISQCPARCGDLCTCTTCQVSCSFLIQH